MSKHRRSRAAPPRRLASNEDLPLPSFYDRMTRVMHPGKRAACVGGCGRMVVRELGECRQCRRARVHAGRKRVRKAEA